MYEHERSRCTYEYFGIMKLTLKIFSEFIIMALVGTWVGMGGLGLAVFSLTRRLEGLEERMQRLEDTIYNMIQPAPAA